MTQSPGINGLSGLTIKTSCQPSWTIITNHQTSLVALPPWSIMNQPHQKQSTLVLVALCQAACTATHVAAAASFDGSIVGGRGGQSTGGFMGCQHAAALAPSDAMCCRNRQHSSLKDHAIFHAGDLFAACGSIRSWCPTMGLQGLQIAAAFWFLGLDRTERYCSDG